MAARPRAVSDGRRRLTRRALVRWLALGGVAAFVGACTTPTTQNPSFGGPSSALRPVSLTTVPSGAAVGPNDGEHAQAGGTLRWGLLGNIVTLDGHNSRGGTHVFN